MPARRLKAAALHAGRLLLYAFVTAVVTLMLAFAISAGTNHQGLQLLKDVRNSSRATACVLALPVGETGRDPALVAQCFTQNGISPPELSDKG